MTGPDTAARADSVDPELPDVGFTLGESADAGPPADPETTVPVSDPAEQSRDLIIAAAADLVAAAPEGWVRVDAVFVLTVAAEQSVAFFSDAQERVVPVEPPPTVVERIRAHRRLAAETAAGAWWRLLLTVTDQGQVEADYDYGDEPFPEDQLYPPEVYRADLEVFPRERIPVWMAAYLNHGDRQLRPLAVAGAQARADRTAGIAAEVADSDLPPLPAMAARWAVLSAGFVAVGSEWGPRLQPATYWFEGARRSGCSLIVLPDGRAVLSGGVWNAPELDRAYNDGAPLPELYRGAPEWVADPLLNARINRGLLTFCYWWDGRQWYRGASPAAEEFAEAVPGVWTQDTVVDIVAALLWPEPTEEQRGGIRNLVSAAETGAVTRELLTRAFAPAPDADADPALDLDEAFYLLLMAGVTAPDSAGQ